MHSQRPCTRRPRRVCCCGHDMMASGASPRVTSTVSRIVTWAAEGGLWCMFEAKSSLECGDFEEPSQGVKNMATKLSFFVSIVTDIQFCSNTCRGPCAPQESDGLWPHHFSSPQTEKSIRPLRTPKTTQGQYLFYYGIYRTTSLSPRVPCPAPNSLEIRKIYILEIASAVTVAPRPILSHHSEATRR